MVIKWLLISALISITDKLGLVRPTLKGIVIIRIIFRQAGADITGQLQVRPMLYTLYISINLRVVKMLHTDNKQQITK